MQIRSIEISNFRSFWEPATAIFAEGFNVVVGANNSGKTTLLRALRPKDLVSERPAAHRSILSVPELEDLPVRPTVVKEHLVLTQRDLRLLLREGGEVRVPLQAINQFSDASARDVSDKVMSAAEISVRITTNVTQSGGVEQDWQLRCDGYSFHFSQGGGHNSGYAKLSIDGAAAEPKFDRLMNSNVAPWIADRLDRELNSQIFRFLPERFGLGTSSIEDVGHFRPDARNLPARLHMLQSENPAKFLEFNDLVSSILPAIAEVRTIPVGPNVTIKLRISGQPRDRADLLLPINECGTGVPQVLAILHAATEMGRPKVIVVDEPSSFLHPGAGRRLIRALRDLPARHQYIVATHSPEIIGEARPSTINRLVLLGPCSAIVSSKGADFAALQHSLSELGVELSDFFRADALVWVEGPTERIAFPEIWRRLRPGGKVIEFVPVINTGDFETAKEKDRKRALEQYRRISDAGLVLVRQFAVILDRETKSDTELAKETDVFKGRVRRIQRRSFENYLIDFKALSIVLSRETGNEVNANAISEWLREEMNLESSADFYASTAEVDAARLLTKLFDSLARVPYQKTRHSVELTRIILDKEPERFEDIAATIEKVLEFV